MKKLSITQFKDFLQNCKNASRLLNRHYDNIDDFKQDQSFFLEYEKDYFSKYHYIKNECDSAFMKNTAFKGFDIDNNYIRLSNNIDTVYLDNNNINVYLYQIQKNKYYRALIINDDMQYLDINIYF